MTTPTPDIARGVFGLREADLPPTGLSRTAVWPVIESAPGRPFGAAIASIRRQLAWNTMLQHTNTIVELELVNAPRWAAGRVDKSRAAAGLMPATTR